VGYQAPGGRVPLYAAGHANGFGNLTVEFMLPDPAASTPDWNLY